MESTSEEGKDAAAVTRVQLWNMISVSVYQLSKHQALTTIVR